MTDFLQGVNLYLIGMMGSGKTTIGKQMAQQLGYQFFDTDALIEQLAGQTIREFFATAGEVAFRQLETQVLSQLCAYKRLVIATGGGIILQRENWSYLRHGIVVWLDVPVAQLALRLQTDTTRPLLQTEDPLSSLQALLQQRQPLYAQADVRVEWRAQETPAQGGQRAIELIQQVLKPAREIPNGQEA